MPQTLEKALGLAILDIERINSAKLETSPFNYLIASECIRTDWKDNLIQAYPEVPGGGSFPLSSVSCTRNFMKLIDELNSDAFRRVVERKFSLSLEDKPTMFTVRANCRLKDGKVHTDSESKIITVLLYMNPNWEDQGGRLRVLKSTNIDDMAVEVSPSIGNILIFKRCDYSYHGHLPFEGTRRVIQMNWVTHQKFVDQEQNRHKWSAYLKELPFFKKKGIA